MILPSGGLIVDNPGMRQVHFWLAEGGLTEAVLALVQAAPGSVTVDALPDRRGPAEAEAAVYRLVAASQSRRPTTASKGGNP